MGAVLTGVFTAPSLGGTGGEDFAIASQVAIQLEAVIITVILSAVVAFIALKVADLLVGIRVSEDEEKRALTSHLTAKRLTRTINFSRRAFTNSPPMPSLAIWLGRFFLLI